MNQDQMMLAINCLAPASIKMRKIGDWYVSQAGVEVKTGSTLESRYGNGAQPMLAVQDHWAKLTQLQAGEYLVVTIAGDRLPLVWNGFMWEPVLEGLG